jgi:hypothetical protein
MSRWVSLALACAFGFASSFSGRVVRAQSLDRAGIGFTGTIASVDSFALVVRADNGKLVTFPIEEPFRVPEGLVPGTRITVRYEVVDRTRYRLVGVKIASAPMEHDSTTEPPALLPAPPSAPEGIRQEPGTSPVLPEPQAEPETPEPAEPTPRPTAAAAAAPAEPLPAPALDASRPVRATSAAAALPAAPPTATPGSGEIATLVTLVLASGGLLWLALARV